MPIFPHLPLALIGSALVLVTPAHADPAGTETISIRVHRPAAAARQDVERRIAAAALEACGASSFSAPGVKQAVARSACWHDSYARGIAQLDGDARADAGPHTTETP